MILRDKITITDKRGAAPFTIAAHVGWNRSEAYYSDGSDVGIPRQLVELTATVRYRADLEDPDRQAVGVKWRGKAYTIDAEPRVVMRGPDPHHISLALRRQS